MDQLLIALDVEDVEDGRRVFLDLKFHAVAAGASYVVVGRPIVNAPDPRAAAESIAAEIEGRIRLRSA